MIKDGYFKQFEVRWSDLDPNFHLRHTAYNDYAAHVRYSCLADHGFSLLELKKLSLGGVNFCEKTEYLREVQAGATITINFMIAGLSEDRRKWRIQNEVFLENGVKSALITVDGAWFNVVDRKIAPAPVELYQLLLRLPKSQNFQTL